MSYDTVQSDRNPEKEDVETAQDAAGDLSHESECSSTFSESRHVEGAGRISLSRTTSQRLERVNTTSSNVLSTIRSRAPQKSFSHPLTHTKTSPDVIVEFDGPDDP